MGYDESSNPPSKRSSTHFIPRIMDQDRCIQTEHSLEALDSIAFHMSTPKSSAVQTVDRSYKSGWHRHQSLNDVTKSESFIESKEPEPSSRSSRSHRSSSRSFQIRTVDI